MTRFDEVLQEAKNVYPRGQDELAIANNACGYLSQWVVQLERDLKETKENYLSAVSRYQAKSEVA